MMQKNQKVCKFYKKSEKKLQKQYRIHDGERD